MFKYLLALILLVPLQAGACNVTVSPGANLQTSLNNLVANGVLCLNTGTYTLSSTLSIPAGKTLKGLGSGPDSTVLSSSATRAIGMGSNTTLHNVKVQGPGGAYNEYGVLAHYVSNVLLWTVKVDGFLISVGCNGVSGCDIADTYLQNNGKLSNTCSFGDCAEPNIWINDSTDVSIWYGELIGTKANGRKDGEIACYNSSYVAVEGTYVTNSGASAIYMVNCDNSSAVSTTITSPGEWGLDIVSGSDYFYANNNYVAYAYFGGSVFDEPANAGGTYTNNTFVSNNQMNWNKVCNGINVSYPGTTANMTLSGNTVNTGSLTCSFNP